ncbi:MAG: efflux RND transporter periplasmic adaptor subunit [Leptolyngbya sp. SIO3F4]|nr:efflux RND transporter periplasmic adaptor subunit [Leptolyngbya sp. SIO3F4]
MPWLFFVLLLVGGTVFSLTYAQKIIAKKNLDANAKTKTVFLERLSLPITILANGIVQSERSINISPETPGVLKSLLVEEGATTNEGDIIARMDDSDLQGQLTEAQGLRAAAAARLQKLVTGTRPEEIEQSQARLLETQALRHQIKSNLRRDEELWADGAISTRELDNTRADYEQALARESEAKSALEQARNGSRVEDIAQARAEVMQAEGALEIIQAQLEDTVLRAPFTGVVIEKYVEPGAFISPTTRQGSAVSSAIVTIAGKNEIIANVAEANIAQLHLGQKAAITADAYPDQIFQGEVTRIAPQAILVQNVTNFEVNVAIIEDLQNLLRPGMNVEVEFNVGELEAALTVPTAAIVREEGGTGVYMETENGDAEWVQIETGVTVGGQTEVVTGLNGDEKIFISFPDGLRPDSSIPGI